MITATHYVVLSLILFAIGMIGVMMRRNFITVLMSLELIFNAVNLMWVGVFFFGLMVLFSLLTIPVEFNASNRGMKLLDEAGLLTNDADRRGARKVLTAAGLTYLAAAVTSILQLLYYISIIERNQ